MKVSKKLKQIVSVILLIAMVITMLPNGQLIKAAEDGMNINIHFYDEDAAYGGKVYLQYWQEEDATVSTEGELFKDFAKEQKGNNDLLSLTVI